MKQKESNQMNQNTDMNFLSASNTTSPMQQHIFLNSNKDTYHNF